MTEKSSRYSVRPSRRAFLRSTTVTAGVAAGLSGCLGSDDDDAPADDGTVTNGETPKEFTLVHGDTSDAAQNVFDQIAAEFEDETGHQLQMEYIAFGEMHQRVGQMIRGGNPPELIGGNGAESAGVFYNDGILTPITEVVEETGIPENTALTVEGEHWTIPDSVHIYYTPIRRDLVEQVGGDLPAANSDEIFEVGWDTYTDWVRSIDQETDTRGVGFSTGSNIRGNFEVLMYMWSNGVRIWRGEHPDIEVSIGSGTDRDRALEVVEYVQELHEHAPQGSGWGWGDVTDAFSANTIASCNYNFGRLNQVLADVNPDIQPGLAPMQTPSNNRRDDGLQNWLTVSSFAVLEDSENPDVAKEFLKWFYDSPTYMDWLHAVPFHNFPPDPEIAESEEYLDNEVIQNNPEVLEFNKRALETAAPPTFAGDNGTLNLAFPAQHDAGVLGSLFEKVLIQGEDPEPALDDVVDELRERTAEVYG